MVELSNELARHTHLKVVAPADATWRDRLSRQIGDVVDLPPGSRRNPVTVLNLTAALRRLGVDVVHAHAARTAEMLWWADRLPGGGPAAWLATKHNTRRRRVFDRVPLATAVSGAVADTIDRSAPVPVVHNGVRVRSVERGPRPDVFTFVAVGRLDPYKGMDRLVRAAAELDFPFRLRVAGDGGERGTLESLVAELGLEERVELLGHREDVEELIGAAHVQVVPSRSEGFGLAIAEGLHYARVLLSTPVGIAPEILPPELLLDPADLAAGLRRVRADYDRLEALFSETAAAQHGRFTWSAAAERYLEIYETVLGARGERREGEHLRR